MARVGIPFRPLATTALTMRSVPPILARAVEPYVVPCRPRQTGMVMVVRTLTTTMIMSSLMRAKFPLFPVWWPSVPCMSPTTNFLP